MFASRVLALAEGLGHSIRMLGSAAALFAAAEESGCRFVLIDLSLPGLNVAETVGRLKREYADARLVAYGPHVHEALLKAAEHHGCNAVLSRGEFNQQAAAMLREHLGN